MNIIKDRNIKNQLNHNILGLLSMEFSLENNYLNFLF
jgi:hypothetical protein